VRLFHSLLCGDFPSRWLQLLQCPLVSLLGVLWPGRGESVTELMLFMNFLVHSYTCYSDRHASPYWTFILRWISMGFTPSLLKKKGMTERCSSLVHVASGAAIFTLLLRRRVAYLHLTATCRPHFKPWTSLLSAYKTVELCFELLSHFYGFHLTLPRTKPICTSGSSVGARVNCHSFAVSLFNYKLLVRSDSQFSFSGLQPRWDSNSQSPI
jgi:hypothetical protein